LDIVLLKKQISIYKQNLEKDPEKHARDLAERKERIDYYQSWTKDLILAMTVEGLYACIPVYSGDIILFTESCPLQAGDA
jgi:hypothetical protein